MQTLHFVAKFENLDAIREFVGGIATRGGFSDKEIYNIKLATDEAASNIIEHAYEGVRNGIIEISCGLQKNSIIVILVDHGESFDPSAVPMPDLKADLSERQVGGLGIYLMRKLMDEVRYDADPKHNRNILTLIKRRG
jgi:anti-sigma regulatory factor (Ser/Thr protein kinase)